ncbi:MAG: metallophosphoesterase, partial [Gemmatimonadales bacterium]
MRIAVVGDVHGHLALLYAILGRWRRETGKPIHLILQVGDLGAFDPGSRLDRATQRHAQSDPEELGFGEFAGPNPPATLLDPRPPLVFIPGNHEDFELLDRCEAAAGGNATVSP